MKKMNIIGAGIIVAGLLQGCNREPHVAEELLQDADIFNAAQIFHKACSDKVQGVITSEVFDTISRDALEDRDKALNERYPDYQATWTCYQNKSYWDEASHPPVDLHMHKGVGEHSH